MKLKCYKLKISSNCKILKIREKFSCIVRSNFLRANKWLYVNSKKCK